ncbi:MAG: kelch repeat-containing protein [Planctomycetota bacterium]
MHRSALLAVFACSLAAFADHATGQANWTLLAPATSPTGRAGTTGCSDGVNLWMFGGNLGGGVLSNELWRFDGTNWTLVTPLGTPPSARDWYAACWDGGRGRLVIFGGRDGTNAALNDTWEFDGASWIQHAPNTVPTPRRWVGLAYDAPHQRCIMFGGHDGNASSTVGYNAETWAWNGTDWTLLAPATVPPARGRYQFSTDFLNNETVMYGGRAAAALNDTWIWNGIDWHQVVTAHSPGSTSTANNGLFAYAATWDLLRRRHILFGGTQNSSTLANTWEFDGADWTMRTSASSPSGRTRPCMAFLLPSATTFLFGGFSTSAFADTWSYQTASFPSVSYGGNACPNALGLPVIALTDPWLGDPLRTRVTTLPPTAQTQIVFGFAPTSIQLGFLGYPACTLQADPLVLVAAAYDPNTLSATLTLTPPVTPGMVGVTMYEQGITLDFTTTPSLSLTGLATVVFGAR